jgi:MscS family membrane protein
LFILQNLNINVSSLLAGLGIGGVALALAAKDTVANFFGSIMIFVDRPFQIGDWVVVSGVEGIVEEVGFRSTRIRTFYNSQVTVPNAKFTETNIDNYGRRMYRRTTLTLNLTYDTTPEQMQAFVEGIRAVIKANPHTRKDLYEAHMSGFGAHSLDVLVYFFLKVETWSAELRERHNIYLELLRLAQELKVQFAFPTQTLHVDSIAEPGKERRLPPLPAQARMAEVVNAFGPSGSAGRPAAPKITETGYFAAAPEPAEDKRN